MPNFSKPAGINFRSSKELPASVLSKTLCQTVSFLQGVQPYIKLQKYHDWWEHDGCHFHKEQIDFHGLFQIVRSPRDLLQAMTTDDNVFIGIAPDDNSWYLRFYLNWDDEGLNLIGRFDITLPAKLAERFRKDMAEVQPIELAEQDTETYYRSIS